MIDAEQGLGSGHGNGQIQPELGRTPNERDGQGDGGHRHDDRRDHKNGVVNRRDRCVAIRAEDLADVVGDPPNVHGQVGERNIEDGDDREERCDLPRSGSHLDGASRLKPAPPRDPGVRHA